jgi:hypothetical protein
MLEVTRRSWLALAALPLSGVQAQTVPQAPAGGQIQSALPIFVLNSLDGNVSVIDPVSWSEVRRIPTGKEPHHLYLTTDE